MPLIQRAVGKDPNRVLVQLILEQHRFELYRPTYTQIFFNKCVL